MIDYHLYKKSYKQCDISEVHQGIGTGLCKYNDVGYTLQKIDDLFKLLRGLYSALYTSQDHMNKVWVKVKRCKTIDPEEMHWDFQTAKQFMDDTTMKK
eukprot:10784993-Ditylum_brightwellii.AAC.1